MSRNVKIGCAVAAAIAVLMIAICSGVFFWGARHVNNTVDELKEAAPQLKAEAQKVAANGPDACVTEGLKRSGACGQFDIKCHGLVGAFGRVCLDASNAAPIFCGGVPAQTDFLEAADWAVEQCERHGASQNPQCTGFFTNTVAAFCDKQRRTNSR